MELLRQTFFQKIEETSTGFIRYLHNKIDWDARLIAILGARGTGKSTLILQHIKLYENIDKVLYVSADDIYFTAHRLADLASDFYANGGEALYIDEIHKYPGWSTEIKNIYDTYSKLRLVYTGSSILELEKGGADLSRRKLEYRLYGLSFREYLSISKGIELPVCTLEDVLANAVEFPYKEHRPVALFREYVVGGYYPYFMEPGYRLRLQAVINQILENDIRDFAGMTVSTARALKKLMYIVAQSAPFKPNYSKIAEDLHLNRNLTADLMIYLEKAQLVNILRDGTWGISSLGKVEKVYLNNTNLAYAIAGDVTNTGNARETVFFSMLAPVADVVSSPSADFKTGKYTFEVVGRNKSGKQIKGIEDAYIVKDDIEHGDGNILPLWAFGFLY